MPKVCPQRGHRLEWLPLTTFLLTFLLCQTIAGAAEATLTINGSFESGTPDPNTDAIEDGFTNCGVGECSIAGWTISTGIDYVGDAWLASDGSRSIDLNGESSQGAGSISQIFSTTPGSIYQLTFDLAGNFGGGPQPKTVRVTAAGQSMDFSFDATSTSPTNVGWTGQAWAFTASGSSTTLTFTSLTTGAYGPAIDNVVLVPEPASLSLVGFALAGIAITKRRRKVSRGHAYVWEMHTIHPDLRAQGD